MDERDDAAAGADADHARRPVAIALARALLAQGGALEAGRARATRALGRAWPWLPRLLAEIRRDFGPLLDPTQHDAVVRQILAFKPFCAAFDADVPPQVRAWFPFHEAMGAAPRALGALRLPVLATPGDLARWLHLSPGELDWFADCAGWGGGVPRSALRHYDYRWQAKARGGFRLIEAPKPRLRALQRQILHGILARVPVHPAAHGCVRGRSALSHAQHHVGAPLLLQLDLADFFTSVPAARVHALFRALGYPAATARYLTGLTTHCTPRAVLSRLPCAADVALDERQRQRQRRAAAESLGVRHLPQGAPSSPALANLCAYRLDLRLSGAALECGARYTRYVDDLAFSCASPSRARGLRFAQMAYGIIVEEGFAPNVRKTRMAGAAQRQRVTGWVVNAGVNVPRAEVDQLKAILTNCVRQGAASQNRLGLADFRAHLRGRVAHVSQGNPARGLKLQALFERIVWD